MCLHAIMNENRRERGAAGEFYRLWHTLLRTPWATLLNFQLSAQSVVSTQRHQPYSVFVMCPRRFRSGLLRRNVESPISLSRNDFNFLRKRAWRCIDAPENEPSIF